MEEECLEEDDDEMEEENIKDNLQELRLKERCDAFVVCVSISSQNKIYYVLY